MKNGREFRLHMRPNFKGYDFIAVDEMEMRQVLLAGEIVLHEEASGLYRYKGELYAILNNSMRAQT